MKMIFILLRDSPERPIYTPYMEEIPDDITETKKYKIWETDSDEKLLEKLTQLIQRYPKTSLHPVDDMQWAIEAVLSD